ncbi:DUF5131 family protein [Dactylosporangium sucinum]|uniref:Phage Gp37Gp68 family protein n=1 Tax=Dactylosporangium sucinum TaxID=1424081 RepID=A0A917WR01_9ACTN|nr:DUF5131 family protein [Dactylosporangium sucinum]GGM22408.1 hypothetical protein GCM10007977_024460 [Dactylosporangium sucinum]
MLVRAFAVMARCPQHTFLILTKRPTVLRTRLSKPQFVAAVRGLVAAAAPELTVPWPLPNVQLGVSVEDQHHAWRVLELLRIPAAVHWVSAEPLIGPLDLTRIVGGRRSVVDGLAGEIHTAGGDLLGACPAAVRWVVVGGESGAARGIRPMAADWVRHLRAQCTAAGTAFFFKQTGTRLAAELGLPRKGSAWSDLPAEFRHRAYPDVPALPALSRGGPS